MDGHHSLCNLMSSSLNWWFVANRFICVDLQSQTSEIIVREAWQTKIIG